MNFEPSSDLKFDSKVFHGCLRSAPQDLEDVPRRFSASARTTRSVSFCLLTAAAQDFVTASVPDSIFRSFMLASMTAPRKEDGIVRGIATGRVFRAIGGEDLGSAIQP